MYKMNDIRAEVVRFDARDVVATSGAKLTFGVKGSVLKAWEDYYSVRSGNPYDNNCETMYNFNASFNKSGLVDGNYYEIKMGKPSINEGMSAAFYVDYYDVSVSLTGNSGTVEQFGDGTGSATWGEKSDEGVSDASGFETPFGIWLSGVLGG